jgi:hypothetical protein
LYEKFLLRTGGGWTGNNDVISMSGSRLLGFFAHYFGDILTLIFGSVGVWSLYGAFVGAVFLLSRMAGKNPNVREEPMVDSIAPFVIVLPLSAMTHFLVFRNHSVVHHFSTLKFALVVSVVPLVALPLMAWNAWPRLRGWILRHRLAHRYIPVFIFLCASLYVLDWHPEYSARFLPPLSSELEDFVARQTSYNDFVVSPDLEIPRNPPHSLSISMKRVYRMDSFEEALRAASSIEGADLCIIARIGDGRVLAGDRGWQDRLDTIERLAESSATSPGRQFRFYRIRSGRLPEVTF